MSTARIGYFDDETCRLEPIETHLVIAGFIASMRQLRDRGGA
jgi:hypothetical protein